MKQDIKSPYSISASAVRGKRSDSFASILPAINFRSSNVPASFVLKMLRRAFKHPIVLYGDRIELGPAQSKSLAQQAFRTIAVVRLCRSPFSSPLCRRGASARRGQNENRHKTAFNTLSLLVNPKKLGAFSQPGFLRQGKT